MDRQTDNGRQQRRRLPLYGPTDAPTTRHNAITFCVMNKLGDARALPGGPRARGVEAHQNCSELKYVGLDQPWTAF